MKINFKKGIILALVAIQMMFVFTACGDELEVDPTKNADKGYIGSTEKDGYKFDVYEDYVKITEYVGKDETVTVPKTLEDKEVKEIADQSFKDEEGRTIKKVILPNTITTMTQYAFYQLSTVEEIVFDGENPNFVTEDGVIYNKDKTLIIAYPAMLDKKEYNIPDTVVEIEDSQFSNLAYLENITIPESVTSIGNWAFKNCTKLKSVKIPNSVEFIGTAPFIGCVGMKEFTMSQNDIESFNEATLMGTTLDTIYGYPGTTVETIANDLGVNFESLA